MNRLEINQKANVILERPRKPINFFDPKGVFHIEHIRNGKVINEFDVPNGVTNEGKDFIFDATFHGTATDAQWYLGLIDLVGWSILAATDIYDEINGTNGWDEFANYGAGSRIEWVEAAASGQAMTNAANVATFTITGAGGTVKGCFLCGIGAGKATVGDHANDGILWATALFTAGDVVVVAADQLKVTYIVSA